MSVVPKSGFKDDHGMHDRSDKFWLWRLPVTALVLPCTRWAWSGGERASRENKKAVISLVSLISGKGAKKGMLLVTFTIQR